MEARRVRAAEEGDLIGFANMMRRMIRAYGRRVAEADPVDLRALEGLHAYLDDAIARAVAGQRATGFSWAEIAAGLGVSRQSAWERFRRPLPLSENGDVGPEGR